MMFMRHSKHKKILLAIFGLLLVVGGLIAYLLFVPAGVSNDAYYENLGWTKYTNDELSFSLYYPADFLTLTPTEEGVWLTHEIGKAKFYCGEQPLSEVEIKPESIHDFSLEIRTLPDGERWLSPETYNDPEFINDPNNWATLKESGRKYIWGMYGHTNCTYPYFMEVFSDPRYFLATYQGHHHQFGGFGTNEDEYWFTNLDFIEGEPVKIPEEEYELMRDRIVNSFEYTR